MSHMKADKTKSQHIKPVHIKLARIGFCFCLFLSTCFLSGCQAQQNTAPVSQTGFYFDTVITISIYDTVSKEEKEAALTECFALAENYEKLFSPTIQGSDVWNINHSSGSPVTVSDDTVFLLEAALSYSALTDGQIDPTIQSVSTLWDFQDKENAVIPDSKAIADALTHVNYENIKVNGNTVTLKDAQASIGLGFIAKGYIADKMKEYLLSQNIKSAIINLGGNLLAVGSKPDSTPFQFGIQKPFDKQNTPITTLPVFDKSLVSSGVYERYFYENDVLYHHILDTATGYPVQNDLLGVTILSDSSMSGDALSTTCFVLGMEKGMALIESMEDTEAIFITKDYSLHYTSGLMP